MIHGNNGEWDDPHSPTPDVNAQRWGEKVMSTIARYHKGDDWEIQPILANMWEKMLEEQSPIAGLPIEDVLIAFFIFLFSGFVGGLY